MSDNGSVFYCNNAGHSHATYDAVQECDLNAHRAWLLERERAEAAARRRKEK
jgi:hypothetical protein